jgi:formylglycine-generating enzyme required for sulfatase activity
MVVVPAGSFMMGSPASEKFREDHEGPQRKVTIARRFAVGKYEVTFAEWDTCAANVKLFSHLADIGDGCSQKPDTFYQRGKRPVANVSWEDAKEYVAWLSKKTGAIYRLLTEAEWEYSARAGTTTRFSTGATITANQATFHGGLQVDTLEVGHFKPNAFRLHDMHGNVREWVEDCWHYSYLNAPTDGSAWISSCPDNARVIRGGSWGAGSGDLRSADRKREAPHHRTRFTGFRVARTLD